MIEIRKVQKNEISAVYDLIVELAIYEKEPNAVTAKIEDYYTSYDNGLIDMYVVVDSGNIVGMALYYMTFSTWKGKMLYLEDFYIKEEYRSKGTGQELFDAFIKEAKDQHCNMVKWQVLDWNVKAIKFYERNGAEIEKQWFNGKIIF